jgi:hypothetical protein
MANARILGLVAVLLASCSSGPATPPPPDCTYPAGASGDLGLGEVLPAELAWAGAIHADGTTADFGARDFFCNDAYDGYTTMIVLVSAGWCSACPAYIDRMNGMAAALEAGGSLVVYVEVETAAFEPATADDAVMFIDGVVMPDSFAAGIRVGDGDAIGEGVRGRVREFPSVYVVRRRDMRIIADQSESMYQIDFGPLVANPEAPWTPTGSTFEAHCGPAEEEPGEPNDTIATATAISPGAETMGGVCTSLGGDFYRVDIAGPWRFDLYQSLFTTPEPVTHNVDLRLWNDALERIGGSNVVGNHDWIDWQGPAFVEVYGPRSASGTYRVSVSPR